MKASLIQSKKVILNFSDKFEREVSKTELSLKLSEAFPNSTALLLFCRLPWINHMTYMIDSKTLEYCFSCGDIQYAVGEYELEEAKEIIFDIDDQISKILNTYI